MNPRYSVAGPLILIAIGVLFLIHAITPDFSIGRVVAYYWPYLLIAWGGIALIEIAIRFLRGAPIPLNVISTGGWFAVILICCAGLLVHTAWQHDFWWNHITFDEGVRVFGQEHDYAIPPVQKTVGSSPHVVVESFRGNAKIIGSDGDTLSIAGHKSIRAFDTRRADAADSATPVTTELEGNTVFIRCNQDRADARAPVTTDLEISVPKGASLELAGTRGDLDISSLSGDVDLTMRDGSTHLDGIGGGITIATHHTDLVRCTGIKGPAIVRGDGQDIELAGMSGPVTIAGRYMGTLSLRQLAQAVHISNFHAEFEAQKAAGEIRLDSGSLAAQEITGPIKITSRATDITLNGFSGTLELDANRGDIDLAPQHLPLASMAVHSHSGNINLTVPASASFALTAVADRGEVQNEFSDALQEQSTGRGARLEGSIGSGPKLNLVTESGNIMVRKAAGGGSGGAAGTEKAVEYVER